MHQYTLPTIHFALFPSSHFSTLQLNKYYLTKLVYVVSTKFSHFPYIVVEKLKTYEITTKERKGKHYEDCIFMQKITEKYKSTKTIMSMQHVKIEV